MSDIVKYLVPLGIYICFFIFAYLLGTRRGKRFYATGMQWLPIETLPDLSPDDESIFVTDGKNVKLTNCIEYNRHGQPLFSIYKRSIIIGWMPYPKATNK